MDTKLSPALTGGAFFVRLGRPSDTETNVSAWRLVGGLAADVEPISLGVVLCGLDGRRQVQLVAMMTPNLPRSHWRGFCLGRTVATKPLPPGDAPGLEIASGPLRV